MVGAITIHVLALLALMAGSRVLARRFEQPVRSVIRISVWSIAITSILGAIILPFGRDWLEGSLGAHPVWAPIRVLPFLLAGWFALVVMVHTSLLLACRPGRRAAVLSSVTALALAALAIVPYAAASDLSFHSRLRWAPLEDVVSTVEPTAVYFIASGGSVERVELTSLERDSLQIAGRPSLRSALRAVSADGGDGAVVQFSVNPPYRAKEIVDDRIWAEAGFFPENESFLPNEPGPARIGKGDKPTALEPYSARDRTLDGERAGQRLHFAFVAPFYSASLSEDGSWLWTTSQTTIIDDRWVITCLSGRWIIAIDLEHRRVAVVGEGRSPVVVRAAH